LQTIDIQSAFIELNMNSNNCLVMTTALNIGMMIIIILKFL